MDLQTTDRQSQAKPSSTSRNDQATLWAFLEQMTIARASDLARAGLYADAEASLQEAMRYREATPAILDLLARIHAQQGHWMEAEAAWTQALQLNPDGKTYAAGLRCISQRQHQRKFPRVIILAMEILLIFLCGLVSGRFIFLPSFPGTMPVSTETLSLVSTQMLSSSPTSTQESLPPSSPTPTPSPMPTQASSSTPTPFACRITTGIQNGKLNVRSGPGTGNSVVGVLYEGEQVIILGDSNDQRAVGWISITREPDLNGWINSSYCK